VVKIDIDYDSEKDAINRVKHGLSLRFAALLFAGDYKEKLDERQNYGEMRVIATGFIAERLCVCVYTWRSGVRRVISLRKANRREIDAYHKGKLEEGS
jgi:uncharacterized DUF497 family protein